MAENPHVRQIAFLQSATHPDHYPQTTCPEIAIAGRSNVGKSSLLNRLVNRKRLAKVSSTPGRTQLLNFFMVNDSFTICDLPGYGYAKVPIEMQRSWGKMMSLYFKSRESLRAVMLLIDVRRDPAQFELDMIQVALSSGYVIIPVVTKCDKVAPSKRGVEVARIAKKLGLPARRVIAWSAESGLGLEELWAAVERVTNKPVIAAKKADPAPEAESTENASEIFTKVSEDEEDEADESLD